MIHARARHTPGEMPPLKESQIQKQILEWLSANHILAFRQNTGGVAGEHNGKKRFMRFGVPGMADIVAFYVHNSKGGWQPGSITPVWIEVKTVTGKQSEYQKSFQQQVEENGHRYIICRSLADLEKELGE